MSHNEYIQAVIFCQCEHCRGDYIHSSDCAVHNEPAMTKGECDCIPQLKSDVYKQRQEKGKLN